MKTSLGHLPQRKAEELEILTKYIRRAVPAQMVILFGSYARGNWVELDERFDYGVHTTFQSDYDILVLVEHGVEPYGAARKLDRCCLKHQDISEPELKHIQIIVDILFVLRKTLNRI